MAWEAGTTTDGDVQGVVSGGGDAERGRGHQLAKYLSCCGASQCAETHICSRRVTKAGAAACEHCGGAGGGSEWAKTYATALCEIFDCPPLVQRQALDLVTSAVAFASPPSSAAPSASGDTSDADGGRTRSSGSGGSAAGRRGGGDAGGGSRSSGSKSGGGGGGGGGGGRGSAAASNGDGESCCSSGSEGGLGSSWGSVSELAATCAADDAHGSSAAGAGKSRWGGDERAGAGGDLEREDHDEDDDDDEAVRKGIWFPPPSIAGARDPLLAPSSSTVLAVAAATTTPAGAAGNAAGCSAGSGARRASYSATRAEAAAAAAAARTPRATAAGGGKVRPPPRAAASAVQKGDEDENKSEAVPCGTRSKSRAWGARSSPPPTTLAGRLGLWRRGGADSAPEILVDEADRRLRRRRGSIGQPEELDLDPLLPPLIPPGSGDSSSGGGGFGEAGSEFVVLVSREATVRELAVSVGGFPPEWLLGALGLVVRRQVEGAVYDARARAAMKRAVRLLGGKVSWKQVAITEKELAALAQDQDTGRIQDGDQNKEVAVSGRYWKVGLAAAGGGVLLFLSGGVAAPSVTASLSAVGFAAANSVSYVAPSLGAWLGYASTTSAAATAAAAAASGAGSVGAFSAVSGAAGAGVAGYKMTRRTAGVQEFHFLPLHSNWPLDSPESMFEGASEPGLPVFICVPGWHEPGHDPRHTWGGIGYANAAAAAAAAAAATPGVAAKEGSSPPAVEAKAGKESKGRVTSSPPGATAPACKAASSTAAPVVQVAGAGTASESCGAAPVAAGAGTGVSRWFSSAARGTVGNGTVRNGTVGNGAVGNAEPARAGPTPKSSPAPLAPPLGSRDRHTGRNHHSHHRDRRHHNRNPDGFDSGGGGGSCAPAPMASSFIDLGVGRGSRDSKADSGSCSGADRGDGAPCVDVDNEDLRQRRRQRRRNRVGESCAPAGSEAAAAAAGDGIDDGGGEYRGGAGEAADAEKTEMEMEDSWETLPSHAWWRDFVSGGEEHVLVWETGPLTELHAAMRDLAWKKASRRAVNEALKRSALAPVVAAAALPLALLEAASGLDDPWGVVRSRALEAGRLLAAVLLSRPVGSRPVTLTGFSMGAKVVFNCLEALAAAPDGRGLGIVENAVMLGTPIGTKRGRWKRARSAVAGRLINGYSSRDWLLALVYRTKSWSVGVAGTSRVEGCGVENVDLSGLVTWHLNYSRILPTVMGMLRLEE